MEQASERNEVLRFAVGGPDDYRSAVWSLGVDGADAWVAAKPRGIWWRLTVKPDARARLTDSGEAGPTPPGPEGNATHGWRPPGPPRTNWKRGFNIVVPTLEDIGRLGRPPGEDLGLVDWSPAAPTGQAVRFTLWAADSAPKGDHLATLPVPGGDATLVRTYEPIPDGLMRYFHTAVGYAHAGVETCSLVNCDRGIEGEALLFDIPLAGTRV